MRWLVYVSKQSIEILPAHVLPPTHVLYTQREKIEVDMSKGFKKEDGPFVRALEAALASFNVERQAYYNGTFVGNHIHTTLKVCSYMEKNNNYVRAFFSLQIFTLCALVSLEDVVSRHCP